MLGLIHSNVTLYSLTLPIPLPKLIEVPEFTRALITRSCQNVLSVYPEKCIFASARAPIPICTTNEERRFLIALCTVIYLVCWVLSVWLFCRSLKNWTFVLWAGQEGFKLCCLAIAQGVIVSWHVINTLMTSYGALLIYTSHYQVNKGSWEGLLSSTEHKRCLQFLDSAFKHRMTFVLWGSSLI